MDTRLRRSKMEEKVQPREDDRKKGAIPKKPLKDATSKQRSKDDKGKMVNDPYKQTNDFKNKERKPTAYGYVPSWEHISLWDQNHPENPKRCIAIHKVLRSLLNRMHTITSDQLINISDNKLIGYAHPQEYINTVKDLCSNADPEEAQMYDSIFYKHESFWCAIQAAKMAVSMAKLVADGHYQNGFANIRPPGHHATDVLNGYCLFNNVAITANYLLENKLAERILIVDYDVHHGQGTQRMFYNSNKVLYFSIHRYEHGAYWPHLKESDYTYIGDNEGKGYNINVPLNETGIHDYDYLAIIINILLPIAYEFQPSIVLVSAGFDACIGDPEGLMNVTPGFYGHVIQLLSGLAEGKMVVLLEGGYFLPSLTEASLRTVRALLNDPCNKMEYTRHINPSVIETVRDLKNLLRPHWKCFHQFDHLIPVRDIYKFDKYGLNAVVKKFFGKTATAPFPLKGGYPINTAKQEQMFVAQLDCIVEERYNMSQTKVGYMLNYESAQHGPPANLRCPEVHARVFDIMTKFREFGLFNLIKEVEFEYNRKDRMHPAIWDEIWQQLITTHQPAYIIYELGDIQEEPSADLYWSKHSRETCQWSVASLCQLGIEISRGVIRHGIGIVRPPGHHAKYGDGSGFCLVNNVVVTANYLICKNKFKKILIIDFDVHHGDGTQQMTYSRNDIMYISMHRFDDGKFFPYDSIGNYTYVGEENGAGYNLNIPFNTEKMGNSDYLQTWIKIVLPVSYAFDPDLIIVSAGFDAAVNDPLGNYNIFPEVYGHFFQLLKPIGPIIIALEGGYNRESTSLSMVNCARALLGYPLPMPPVTDAKDTTMKTIMNVITVAKPYWSILKLNKWVDTKAHKKKDDKDRRDDKDQHEYDKVVKYVRGLSVTDFCFIFKETAAKNYNN